MKRILLILLAAFALSCSSGEKTGAADSDTAQPGNDDSSETDGDAVGSDGDTGTWETDGDTGGDTDPTDTGDTVEPDEESGEPDDEPAEPECEPKISDVRIATYNTHLFFDTVCDTGNCSTSDFEEVLSASEYSTRVAWLAEAVEKIDADIILLQEIEKESCLADLFEAAGGKFDAWYLGEKGYDASLDTGVMTKGEITYRNKHVEQIDCPECDGGKTTFSHTFLEIHIKLGCREIIVFSAHFKSKNEDDSSRRLAEARAAVKILERVAEQNPQALIVLGGDLNDTPGSEPVEILESSDSLLRVASDLPELDQATYYYHGEAIALDHIFQAVAASGSYVPKSAEVIKNSPSYYSLDPSDHAALRATFSFE
ncbi:endonuclease/exonuclease/phosphatase family protein [bacterium]|nr:endonuclease/exonuclease/phosphatase family protein [bacterium]